MTFEEYKQKVFERYQALEDDEKEHIREAMKEEHAQTMLKLLGPELFSGLPKLAAPKKHVEE